MAAVTLVLLAALRTSTSAAVEDALPPSWQDAALCHLAFDGDDPHADGEVTVTRDPGGAVADGFIGGGWLAAAGNGHRGLHLGGPGLASGRPLTVMMWWRFADAPPALWSASFLGLTGNGRVEFLVRGGGADRWCNLTEPTGVMQIYLQGMTTVNDLDSARPLGLARPPQGWHHSALAVSRQSIELFWDGALIQHYGLKGRELAPGDVRDASIGALGGGQAALVVDEVTVLGRAIQQAELADYVRAARALRMRAGPASGGH